MFQFVTKLFEFIVNLSEPNMSSKFEFYYKQRLSLTKKWNRYHLVKRGGFITTDELVTFEFL
jgi:hypothetical protein